MELDLRLSQPLKQLSLSILELAFSLFSFVDVVQVNTLCSFALQFLKNFLSIFFHRLSLFDFFGLLLFFDFLNFRLFFYLFYFWFLLFLFFFIRPCHVIQVLFDLLDSCEWEIIVFQILKLGDILLHIECREVCT